MPATLTLSRPTRPSVADRDLVRAAEHIEAEVWGGLYHNATPADRHAGGFDVAAMGASTVLSASYVDVLFFNRVLGLGLDAPVTEAGLDALIDYVEQRCVPRFFVQPSPSASPAALFDWLGARGFRHHNNWVKLYRDVMPTPAASTDLRIERIDTTHARAFAALVAPMFDWPLPVQPLLRETVGRVGWHHYLAFDGATPVAAAGLYVSGNIGYLGPAVTLTSYRGRGVQSTFIARRIHDARALGCTLLVTETSEDRPDHPSPSFRNMRRMGFQIAYVRPNYLCTLPQAFT